MSSHFSRVLVAVVAGALWLAAAQPAAAIPGLELRQQDSLENRDEPHKRAVAQCPERKLVVGGGAKVLDGARTRVGLTTLRPGRPPVGTSWGGTFLAVAEAVNGTRPYDWSLRAYAICAPREALAGYYIQYSTSPWSSQVFKPHLARCPDHTHAYGAGVEVNTHYTAGHGRAFVQLYRTSGPLDISRATARAVRLKKVEPHADLMGVDVALTGALNASIGGMVAHQTCAW